MNRERLLAAAIVVVVCAGLAAAWWLLRSEEDRVRAVIREGAAAARARDVVRLDAVLDPAFRTARGTSRAQAVEALRWAFEQRYRDVTVELDDVAVTLAEHDTRAAATFALRVRGVAEPGRPAEDLLGWMQAPSPWTVTLGLRDGRWLVVGMAAAKLP